MLAIDLTRERPSDEEIQGIWQQSIFTHVPFDHLPIAVPAISEFLTAIRSIYVNGGAECVSFSVAPNDCLDWFVARQLYDEISFFEHLLTSSTLREALPMLKAPETLAPIYWERSNAYVLDGELAALLKTGGAYKHFTGSGYEAKLLGQRMCDALFEQRYDDVAVCKTFTPWSDWFYDVAWDSTWLIIDKSLRRVWVLCFSDTD